MKSYKDYLPHAAEQFEAIKSLQAEGLICDDGEFVPSVHYPPITQYADCHPDDVLGTFTIPGDGMMDVYVHFPFCIQACTYCHYPSLFGEHIEERDKYLRYLKNELEIYCNRFEMQQLRPRSILIGGGTPTHLTPAQLEEFLQFFIQKVDLSSCKQFNYDVDPNSLVGEDGKKRLEIMRDY